MKHIDEDWSQNSEPLIKGPQQGDMDIMSKPCQKCSKVVQHIKGRPVNHSCINANGTKNGH